MEIITVVAASGGFCLLLVIILTIVVIRIKKRLKGAFADRNKVYAMEQCGNHVKEDNNNNLGFVQDDELNEMGYKPIIMKPRALDAVTSERAWYEEWSVSWGSLSSWMYIKDWNTRGKMLISPPKGDWSGYSWCIRFFWPQKMSIKNLSNLIAMFFLIDGDYKNSATGLFNAFRRNLEQVHRQLTILVFLLGYSQWCKNLHLHPSLNYEHSRSSHRVGDPQGILIACFPLVI